MRRISKTGIIRTRFDLFVACKDTIRKKAEPRFYFNDLDLQEIILQRFLVTVKIKVC